jgi:outer membrane cobalamin receptor
MKKILVTILVAFGSIAAAAQATIKGRVIDRSSREPLELAYIKIATSKATTLTDKQGYFAITLPAGIADNGNTTLLVSYIGFATKEVSATAGSIDLVVELEKGALSLQEVIITPQIADRSFHTISKIDLNLQPVRSAQDILRTVPGLFIGQHQGGGKSEQIFLRGFDIDHGTDINLTVDGMPVNMVSHAHGQGYADLHFLIPELTGSVDYGKGPYYAPHGNMGTAGYVSMNTLNSLDKSTVKIEGGQFNTIRGLAMIDLLPAALRNRGTNAYVAGEFLYSDGPFDVPQHFNRFNIFGKFNTKIGNSRLSLSASTLNSDWDASGQVPERAVKDGSIGRFGYIDSTEGGYTSRTNVNAKLSTYFRNSSWENQVYYSYYNFNLHSNFTFFLNDPVNGDQIRQREGRNILGYHSRFNTRASHGKWNIESNYGIGFRFDQTRNSELSNTTNRNTVLDYTQLGDIREINSFGYAEKNFSQGNWLINAGLRLDHFSFNYRDKLSTDQLPRQSKWIVSPKLNVQYTFNERTQLYAKAGKGFHSNDARVVVFNGGKQILPAAYGADLGILLKPTRRLLINAAAWWLYLQQEFVYVGDEGVVEPSGKTRRIGIDLSARYQVTKWLFADANINLARPRSIEEQKGNDYIPLAPTLTSTGGISWQMSNGLNGSLRYRYMKDRAANEDKSVIAKGYTVADLSFNYTKKKYEVGIAIENLFDTEWNETQFDTESRLRNEAAPVSEIHFTPGVPFFARLKLAVFF